MSPLLPNTELVPSFWERLDRDSSRKAFLGWHPNPTQRYYFLLHFLLHVFLQDGTGRVIGALEVSFAFLIIWGDLTWTCHPFVFTKQVVDAELLGATPP